MHLKVLPSFISNRLLQGGTISATEDEAHEDEANEDELMRMMLMRMKQMRLKLIIFIMYSVVKQKPCICDSIKAIYIWLSRILYVVSTIVYDQNMTPRNLADQKLMPRAFLQWCYTIHKIILD